MKSFKEYRAEKEGKKVRNPSEQAYFGKHSEEKPAKNPSEQAYFGKHSDEEKFVSEDEDSGVAKNREHGYTSSQEAHVHQNVAPIDKESLSAVQKTAIENYTDDSAHMNKTLHMHHQGHDVSAGVENPTRRMTIKPDHVKSIMQDAGHIDSVLSNHKTTEDSHVYTGIRFSPSQHFHREKGVMPKTIKVDFPSFTSTTTDLDKAKTFAQSKTHENDNDHGVMPPGIRDSVYHKGCRHTLKVHMPKGTHAMSLKTVSFMPGENEVLLHRGHTLEIHDHPEHLGNSHYLWNAHVVHHELNDLSKPVEQ
jgi:hypothetical protein